MMEIRISLSTLLSLMSDQKDRAADEMAKVIKKDYPDYDTAKIRNGVRAASYPRKIQELRAMTDYFGLDKKEK